MELKTLLQDWVDCPAAWNKEIKGLTLNSQEVQLGDLFIAAKGASRDGRHYIEEAIARGASAVLCEEQGLESFRQAQWGPVPILSLPRLSTHIESIAVKFFGDPSASLKMQGVTGTNGKTSTTFLLAQAQTHLGIRTAVLGTVGYGEIGNIIEGGLTTPDPISLQKYLASIRDRGCKAVAMEVSSHGLDQNRVRSIRFESALFTNLTQDHLDYHQTMENYAKAKQKLFQVPSLRRAVINADSEYADKMILASRKDLPIVLHSCNKGAVSRFSKERDLTFITVEEFTQSPKGMIAALKTPWGKTTLRSSLLGEFNLSNLLGVLAELCLQGFGLEEVVEALSSALPPPGRMQRMGGVRDPLILIDYAHTPDALEKALKAARIQGKRQLWCIFGCGGERDQGKRQKMGTIASQYADKIILTNDNPRNEVPSTIINQILQGIMIEAMDKVVVEEDRLKAIQYALGRALPVDTILIAGKGHENVQIMGGTSHPFSDAACVEQLLRKG
jgi:UDP-N-acetylmuramoyl-L-alanyl-D-glutamate--2,6-diaminopimelate ligase